MDHKAFKQDLTYCCKKFQKEGKILTLHGDNLSIDTDGKFVADGNELDPLEMLILVKGYIPEMSRTHYDIYNVSSMQVVSEQSKITLNDIYDFMDGLENVEPVTKNDFYNVGVYIREKFLPQGTRSETLLLSQKNYAFKFIGSGTLVRKFIVHTRQVPGCRKTGDVPTVVEIEGELISAMEDSSVQLLPPGEFKFRILKPDFLFETKEIKLVDGSKKKMTIPTIYYSQFLYLTVSQARSVAEHMVRESLEFEVRKGRRESYTNEELQTKCAEIQEVMLP